MYDFAGHGFVTRSELTTMLNSVVFAAYTFEDMSTDGDKFTDEIANALNNRVSISQCLSWSLNDVNRSKKWWMSHFPINKSIVFPRKNSSNGYNVFFKHHSLKLKSFKAVDHIETLDVLDYAFTSGSLPTTDHHGRGHQKRPSSMDKDKAFLDGVLMHCLKFRWTPFFDGRVF